MLEHMFDVRQPAARERPDESRAYGGKVTFVNCAWVDRPSTATAPITTMKISASISAYSIAVAPRSSWTPAHHAWTRTTSRSTIPVTP